MKGLSLMGILFGCVVLCIMIFGYFDDLNMMQFTVKEFKKTFYQSNWEKTYEWIEQHNNWNVLVKRQILIDWDIRQANWEIPFVGSRLHIKMPLKNVTETIQIRIFQNESDITETIDPVVMSWLEQGVMKKIQEISTPTETVVYIAQEKLKRSIVEYFQTHSRYKEIEVKFKE